MPFPAKQPRFAIAVMVVMYLVYRQIKTAHVSTGSDLLPNVELSSTVI